MYQTLFLRVYNYLIINNIYKYKQEWYPLKIQLKQLKLKHSCNLCLSNKQNINHVRHHQNLRVSDANPRNEIESVKKTL